MSEKRQFNVYLPGTLIHRVKLMALNREASLSSFVERALETWLERLEGEGKEASSSAPDHPGRPGESAAGMATLLSLLPIAYVSEMDRSIRFYTALGAVVDFRSGHRSVMRLGGAMLALHLATGEESAAGGRVGLAMVSHVPLRSLIAELRLRGIVTDIESIVEESFCLSIQIHDPDGLPIQIDEHDPDLHEE